VNVSATPTTTEQLRRPEPAARLREDLLQPDPLLDCLIEVCRLHGTAASRAALTAGLPMQGQRLGLDLAERAAARAGMWARLQRMPLEAIDPAALPAVLILHDERACVLTGWDATGRHAQVLLPETGHGAITLEREELLSRHSGVVLFVRPRFRFDARSTSGPTGGPTTAATRPRHWFWSAVLEQRGLFADVLLAALLVNLFALATPLFTMNVYDRVVPNQAFETLWALAIGVALVLGADMVLRLLRSRFVDEASARIDVQLSATLMERVLGMRLEGRPESVGSFAANLRGFEQVRDFIAASTVTTLIDVPFALLFLAVIAWISPWLALPVVAVGATVLALGWVLQRRLHALAETTYRAGAQRNATLVESIAGLETIKSQGAEGTIQARWEQTNAFLSAAQVRMRALSARATYGSTLLAQSVPVMLVVIGVYLISQRDLTMGALIACTMLASRALSPMGQVVALLMQYQTARTALDSLDQLMKQPQERPEGSTFLERTQLRGEIEFRSVSFSYPGRDEKVLDNVSFRVQPGEKVALIGRVGSGKSTIQRLIMGLYQPGAGAVLLDGIDLRQLDPADVRRNQAYVSQEVTLFYGTLRQNIAFGQPHATDAAVVEAAEVAGLGEFVKRHPKGFDMTVGERGESLSGGQRQCVGLARAVVHNTPILLLDEPTSAMDFTTESQVTQRMAEFARDRTVVLVTHRTSMLSMVERVIVIDGGRVVADGPRDRIMEALAAGRIARAA
jgi:ATP-binding cassette subfamily C protein LapB